MLGFALSSAPMQVQSARRPSIIHLDQNNLPKIKLQRLRNIPYRVEIGRDELIMPMTM
ncbi:hypothetical protein SS50377_26073 [Spironucleus salmonicida]|uniref:Uncharacterized protein n=1 Tax=Spironucleus salmonicida TaxID=348837 RepID=V6LNL0_9EUKA|nr:hypothetical protein SS50377_26051 [Spironucleus salmonicida]KAH0571876.1 hypothetical protein SS50377_26073 [Spironucleus salmonicida]|eukprot:EST42324.1 Hypothetical protein SS50377_18109 [Spironucleus salmonicida]